MDSKIRLSKSDAAYLALRKKIPDFTLAPGQNISINRLSDELRFSQTPLREALFALKKDGFVIKNRNESFSVTHLDQDYIKNLFEYGMMLYDQRISKGGPIDHYFETIKASSVLENATNTVNLDLFYECAQISAENQLISKQLEIFRCKSASVRRAIQQVDNELYSFIYQEPFIIDDKRGEATKILKAVHARKNISSNRIATAVLIYSSNKGHRCNTSVFLLPEVQK
jgi:biotin operon repressor